MRKMQAVNFYMRRSILILLTLCTIFPALLQAQIYPRGTTGNPLYWKNRKPDAGYWQQDVHYDIKARIDEEAHRIDGEQQLRYTNNSPDTLHVVYFHLFQNAFNEGSYLRNLERAVGKKPRLGSHEAAGEGIIIDALTVDNAAPAAMVLDNTILQVKLAKPLLPGAGATFDMKFRTWYDDGSTRRRMKMYDAWGAKHYNGVQWYPKISVYDRKFGWDTYQHLNKEFYGDFGSFDVALDFPSSYVVEATGLLTNREEVLPDTLRAKLDMKLFESKPWDEAPSIITPYVKGERKVWKYSADGVHDFAFTADPSYRIGDSVWNGIQCVAVVQEPHASGWQNAPEYIASIIRTFSEDIGPYAYPKMVAADAADGMEYPMITLDGGSDPGYRGLLVHEIGHNWFYGMVGSNETYRAAMDEGFTQFLTAWGLRRIDGDTALMEPSGNKWERRFEETSLVIDKTFLNRYTLEALRGNELPLSTHSNDFRDALHHEGGYGLVYHKTAAMLYNLEYVLGDSLFLQAMQHYFRQWRFAHPYFEDFRASIIGFTHVDLNWFFDQWFETTKTIDYSIESARRVRGSKDDWAIRFRRLGKSQMPVDFTVTGRDGRKQSFTIPNTWFSKDAGPTVLPKWYGWSRINPVYTAQVSVPGGLRHVQIDTSYRLADMDWTNNYFAPGLFSKNPGIITRFDGGTTRPVDRRHYRTWIRPDVWWNAVDGIKAGVHIEGDYLGILQQVDASLWWNTRVLHSDRYATPSGEGRYARYRPLSFTVNLASPFSKALPKLFGELSARDLDGLRYLRAGASYRINSNNRLGFHLLSMQRRDPEDLDYLLAPGEWSSREERPNSSANLSFRSAYSYDKGDGALSFLARAPFMTGNRSDAFDYSFLQLEATNTHELGKLELRTRLFGRYGTGQDLPYESLLFAGGANPEELMENKFTRSVGFVPHGEDWSGISRYEPVHFQQGGGLNLRGYNGYFLPDTRDGLQLVGYKGRSGVSVSGELDFDGLIKLKPRATKSWLHLDAYLFADAGIMELSRYVQPDYTRILPTEMWSDVHVDAGLGFAATIKKFGPFAQAKPLTIRVDFPLFLNRAPFGNPQYAAFRYVIGINRAF